MKEINCHIIQDILPLYVDEVVSDDTREMVDEHLKHCETCNKEVKFMKQELFLPIEKEVPMIKNLKKKWRNKRLMISGFSILLTGLVLFGAQYFIFHYDTFIPYSESLIQIEEQDDGSLVSHYYGESFYFVSATEPMTGEIDGEAKSAVFFYYTKTISNNPSRELFGEKAPLQEQDSLLYLDSIDNVDVVYYVEFDPVEIFDRGHLWESVIDRAELIWEK